MQVKRASTAVLCAAVTTGLIASTAKAIFVFDVRAVSATGNGNTVVNAKSAVLSGPGTVTFNLIGMIQPATDDGNPNNEASNVMLGSFLTTGSAVKGNLAATVVPQLQNAGYSTGTIQDLDGDGDLDVGSNVSTSQADYWAARATDTTNGLPGQQALLGTLTLNVSFVDLEGGVAFLNFRKRTGASNSVGSWIENGTTIVSNATNVQNGASVQLWSAFDPEPASTGLITVIGLTTLARRKSRRT